MKKTPLYEKHCELGGKIIDFNGWALFNIRESLKSINM